MIQIAKMFYSLSTVRGTLADLIFQAKEYQKNSSIYSRDHACLSIIICTTGSLFKLYTWSVNKTFFSVTFFKCGRYIPQYMKYFSTSIISILCT
jgi:hypothetical protein